MSELIDCLNKIIKVSVNCESDIDHVLRYYEITIIKFESILFGKPLNFLSAEDKRFKNKATTIKYRIIADLYKELALVVSLKLISEGGFSNLGKFKEEKIVNRPSGMFRYEIATGIKIKTLSIPLIKFRIFSQIKIQNLQLNNLVEVQTDFDQFDVHSCSVNKLNYLLPKGGSFFCPGCFYQQHISKNPINLSKEVEKIMVWTKTNMLPNEISEYLISILNESKYPDFWINNADS